MVALLVQTVFIVTLSVSRTLSEDVPEFQYPCYVDVCTFPTQYCNSDRYERRCNPCSRAVCRQTNVPLACRYICMKHNEITTTVKPLSVTSPRARQQTDVKDNVDSIHLIMTYSAIATTLLIVVLLSYIAYYIHHKKSSKEKKMKSYNQTTRYRPYEFQEISSENQIMCHYCGHMPRPENLNLNIAESSISPPSYKTYDQPRAIFSTSTDTPSHSDPGSIESVPSSATKTVLVKPLASKPIAKVHNNKAARDNKPENMNDSSIQTHEIESLLDSRETDRTDETRLKDSNI